MSEILWQCLECGYKWLGDSFDEDCSNCESEEITQVG